MCLRNAKPVMRAQRLPEFFGASRLRSGFALAGVVIVLDEALAVDVGGPGIGDVVFDFVEVGGEATEVLGAGAGDLSYFDQTPDDRRFGAVTLAGNLFGAQFFDAIEAENGESFGIELLDQRKKTFGDRLVGLFWLWGEFGE